MGNTTDSGRYDGATFEKSFHNFSPRNPKSPPTMYVLNFVRLIKDAIMHGSSSKSTKTLRWLVSVRGLQIIKIGTKGWKWGEFL